VHADVKADYFSPTFAAQSVAAFWNESKTAEGLFNNLERLVTVEERAGIDEMVKSFESRTLKMPLPRATSDGARVRIGKGSIEFRSDRTARVDGVVVRTPPDGTGLDIYIRHLFFSGPHSSSAQNTIFSLFFPAANAEPQSGYGADLVRTLEFFARGTLVTLAIAGTSGAIWVGMQAGQAMSHGHVGCVGKEFVIETRSGGFLPHLTHVSKAEDLTENFSEHELKKKFVNPEAAKAILRSPGVECTPETAAKLQAALQGGPVRKPAEPSQDNFQIGTTH
jgi:hypothetical protein